jgi:hypothetical protein
MNEFFIQFSYLICTYFILDKVNNSITRNQEQYVKYTT